jgi:hypothetical protein
VDAKRLLPVVLVLDGQFLSAPIRLQTLTYEWDQHCRSLGMGRYVAWGAYREQEVSIEAVSPFPDRT